MKNAKCVTSATLMSLDMNEYQHAASHMKPETKEKSIDLAKKILMLVLAESDDGTGGMENPEACFMAALSVALSIKGASFPEDMPQEWREEVEAYVRDKKYPN